MSNGGSPRSGCGRSVALVDCLITVGTIGANIGGAILLAFITPDVTPVLLAPTVVMPIRPSQGAAEPPA